MEEPTQHESDRPGIPGFARMFAAQTKRTGEREAPSTASRIVVVGITVALVCGGVVGIGKLVQYQHQHTKAPASAAKRDDLHLTAQSTSSPARVASTPSASEKAVAGTPAVPINPYIGAAQYGTTSPSGEGPTRLPTSPTGTPKARSSASSAARLQQPSSGGKTTTGQANSSVTKYRIVNNAASRCVDVTDHQSNPPLRTPLQIWDCASSQANQTWQFYSDGTIRSLGMCMSVNGGSKTNGAAVDVFTCDGSASEQWRLTSAGDLVNVTSNKCVDAMDKQTANGTRLQLWTCKGTSNQKWHLA